MKLQLLIPQYTETDELIKPLLDSIALQQRVDFDNIGVIICNDGSDTFLTDDFLRGYPFEIQYHKEPHRGVSGTRNACLDYAAAEYVMFCDADDMFFNMCGLWIILKAIEDGGFDCMISYFLEERKQGAEGGFGFLTHSMDSTFVHGKVFRRAYLAENSIRFDPALTIHEDSYFNLLAQNCTRDIKKCETPLYLWKWRQESVCRHDDKYILKTFSSLIDSNDALIDEFLRRGMKDKAEVYSAMMVFDSYYTMNKPEWIDQENATYRAAAEKRFKDYFTKHKGLWEEMPTQTRMILSNNIRTRQVREGMLMETKTISEWLGEIVKEGQDDGRKMS